MESLVYDFEVKIKTKGEVSDVKLISWPCRVDLSWYPAEQPVADSLPRVNWILFHKRMLSFTLAGGPVDLGSVTLLVGTARSWTPSRSESAAAYFRPWPPRPSGMSFLSFGV